MHQNKFHTEALQRLTRKAEMSSRGSTGVHLTPSDQEIIAHLKQLYKNANKGIRGRGKKPPEQRPREQLPPPRGAVEAFVWGVRGERMMDDFGGGQGGEYMGISSDGRVGFTF
jgi:hypothetical protein